MKKLKSNIKTIINNNKKTLHTIYMIYFITNILFNIFKMIYFIITHI